MFVCRLELRGCRTQGVPAKSLRLPQQHKVQVALAPQFDELITMAQKISEPPPTPTPIPGGDAATH